MLGNVIQSGVGIVGLRLSPLGQMPVALHVKRKLSSVRGRNTKGDSVIHVQSVGLTAPAQLGNVVVVDKGMESRNALVRTITVGKVVALRTDTAMSISWLRPKPAKDIAIALSINWYGRQLMALSQKAISSIIVTASRMITALRILRRCHAQSTITAMKSTISASVNLKKKSVCYGSA